MLSHRAFCHAPECISSLGKIKRNYHLKEVTDKKVKMRARVWFPLWCTLSSHCSLQEVMSNAFSISFSYNLAEA